MIGKNKYENNNAIINVPNTATIPLITHIKQLILFDLEKFLINIIKVIINTISSI